MKLVPRIMALDVGTQGIGVAVSDSVGWGGQGVKTIRRTTWERDLAALKEIIAEYDAKEILIGLPLNMDGTEGKAAREMKRFGAKLERALGNEIPIRWWDERLTTWEAKQRMLKADLSRKKRREKRDVVAAMILLEDYLQNQEGGG